MTVLALQRKHLVLTLVKQKQDFTWTCIIMVIKVICSLTDKKAINLNPLIRT